MVYVLADTGEPLMPCENVVARLLLKQGKAKVKRRTPFTIKLLYDSKKFVQAFTLGVDTGSSHVGTAVAAENGDILYLSDMEIRNDITERMQRRTKYRRMRRNRKTRYRKARWLNRKNSMKSDRFSPTMRSKFDAHDREIKHVRSILPVTRLVLETGTFDPHLMKNPALKNPYYRHWGYQKGPNYGYANTKAKVLVRDNYTCQYCKGKKKSSRLEVHHIVYRSNGGSDEEWNLITLCDECHAALHRGEIILRLKGKKKDSLYHATQMNSIRIQLLKRYPKAVETFGFVTKENRQLLGIPKEHCLDACVIASGGNAVNLKQHVVYYKKCVPKGDYQQTKGIRSEQRIPTCKIQGFRKYDKVRYLGREYFIKGRMSSGYAVLMDITGQKAEFSDAPKGWKTPKLSNCTRMEARNVWITSEQTIPNIASWYI